MTIDIIPFFEQKEYTEFEKDYDLTVLIDVYRATSSMIVAAHGEATEIFALDSLEKMFEEKKKDKTCILCGERNSLKPDGFDFGNSPLKLVYADLKDKKVFISTSNGTRALNAFKKNTKKIIAASFLNLSQTVSYMIQNNFKTILILCAGSWGKFSLEDYLCACIIISRLESKIKNRDDTKRLAIMTGKYFDSHQEELFDTLKNTDHALTLQRLNKTDDVDFIIALIDAFSVIPEVKS
jgi:2-phosphosulfolactate phosphatase